AKRGSQLRRQQSQIAVCLAKMFVLAWQAAVMQSRQLFLDVSRRRSWCLQQRAFGAWRRCGDGPALPDRQDHLGQRQGLVRVCVLNWQAAVAQSRQLLFDMSQRRSWDLQRRAFEVWHCSGESLTLSDQSGKSGHGAEELTSKVCLKASGSAFRLWQQHACLCRHLERVAEARNRRRLQRWFLGPWRQSAARAAGLRRADLYLSARGAAGRLQTSLAAWRRCCLKRARLRGCRCIARPVRVALWVWQNWWAASRLESALSRVRPRRPRLSRLFARWRRAVGEGAAARSARCLEDVENSPFLGAVTPPPPPARWPLGGGGAEGGTAARAVTPPHLPTRAPLGERTNTPACEPGAHDVWAECEHGPGGPPGPPRPSTATDVTPVALQKRARS
ncbi:unnamed protein product, partial [Prorocentrum cordatum]